MSGKFKRRSQIKSAVRRRRSLRERVLFERSGLSESAVEEIGKAERLRRAAVGKGGWKARQEYRSILKRMSV